MNQRMPNVPAVARNAILALLLATNVAAAQPPLVEPLPLPIEQVLDLDADDQRAFLDTQLLMHCTVCHSGEMIEQQRLPITAWQAEVKKMIGWGATLPPDYTDLLAAHLATLHPADAAAAPPTIRPAEAAALAVTADDQPPAAPRTNDVNTLYLRHCAACHGADGAGSPLGPRLVGRGAIAHAESFATLIARGRGRMPAFRDTIPDAGIEAVREWLLRRSFSWTAP